MNLQDIAQIHMTNGITDFESIGCTIDMQEQMIDIVKSEYPDKHYVIVDHWSWNHILLNAVELYECKEAGFFPEFIYSDAVIQDSTCSHSSRIASNLLSKLVNNCIFVTATTCYILVNKGMFKITTLNDALEFPLTNNVND